MDWALSSQVGEDEVALANGNDVSAASLAEESVPSVEVSAHLLTDPAGLCFHISWPCMRLQSDIVSELLPSVLQQMCLVSSHSLGQCDHS